MSTNRITDGNVVSSLHCMNDPNRRGHMASYIERRKFLATLGGAAAAWPLVARAQQSERMRRIGVLMGFDENDPGAKGWLSGFVRGLAELGWTDGRNVRMDVRWAAGNPDNMRTFAKELVDLQSDVILSQTTPVTAALHRETRTIPIIFVMVADPVGAGFAASVPHPGGNLTGFMLWEPSVAGKWLELLTDIAPGVRRVSIMFNPDTAPFIRSYLPSLEAAARSFKVEPIVAPVHSDNRNRNGHHLAWTRAGRRPRGSRGCFYGGSSRAHHIAGGSKQGTGGLSERR